MSFLLGGNGRRRNRATVGASRATVPRSKMAASRLPSTVRAGGGGQVQLQRMTQHRPTHSQLQAQTVKQPGSQLHTGKSANTEQETAVQSVISMEEVMEDLKVLEKQQRESQRKLAASKQTKQTRLEQRTSLDVKLQSLKYTNGEWRAQLVRARDLLSRSTRELGVAKLRSDRSAEHLKAFDSKLRAALLSARAIQDMRRRLDSTIAIIHSKRSIIVRIKEETHDKVKDARGVLNQTSAAQDSLRQQLSDATSRSEDITAATTRVRTEISELNSDLSTAQQMASSTKLRAESIANDVINETHRHRQAVNAMQSQLSQLEADKVAALARKASIREQLEARYRMTLELWARCVTLQKMEGHNPSPKPNQGGPSPSVDLAAMTRALESAKLALVESCATFQQGSDQHKDLCDQLASLKIVGEKAAKEAANIDAASAKLTKEAAASANEHNEILQRLEEARQDFATVRASLEAVRTSSTETISRLDAERSEQVSRSEKTSKDIEAARTLATKNEAESASLKSLWENEKSEGDRDLLRAKQRAEEVKTAFERIRTEHESMKKSLEGHLKSEIDEIRRAQSIMTEEATSKLSKLLKDLPKLQDIPFVYDHRKTKSQQQEDSLSEFLLAKERQLDSLHTKRQETHRQLEEAIQAKEDRRLRELAELERRAAEEAERQRQAAQRERMARKQAEERARQLQNEKAKRVAIDKAKAREKRAAAGVVLNGDLPTGIKALSSSSDLDDDVDGKEWEAHPRANKANRSRKLDDNKRSLRAPTTKEDCHNRVRWEGVENQTATKKPKSSRGKSTSSAGRSTKAAYGSSAEEKRVRRKLTRRTDTKRSRSVSPKSPTRKKSSARRDRESFPASRNVDPSRSEQSSKTSPSGSCAVDSMVTMVSSTIRKKRGGDTRATKDRCVESHDVADQRVNAKPDKKRRGSSSRSLCDERSTGSKRSKKGTRRKRSDSSTGVVDATSPVKGRLGRSSSAQSTGISSGERRVPRSSASVVSVASTKSRRRRSKDGKVGKSANAQAVKGKVEDYDFRF